MTQTSLDAPATATGPPPGRLLGVLLFVGTVVAVLSSLGAPLVPTIAEVDDVSLVRRAVVAHHLAARRRCRDAVARSARRRPAAQDGAADGPRRRARRQPAGGAAARLRGPARRPCPAGPRPRPHPARHRRRPRPPARRPCTGRRRDAVDHDRGGRRLRLPADRAAHRRVRPARRLLVRRGHQRPGPRRRRTRRAVEHRDPVGALRPRRCGPARRRARRPAARPQRGPRSGGAASPRLWGLLAVSLVLLAAWVRQELRTPAPLVDVRLLRSPAGAHRRGHRPARRGRHVPAAVARHPLRPDAPGDAGTASAPRWSSPAWCCCPSRSPASRRAASRRSSPAQLGDRRAAPRVRDLPARLARFGFAHDSLWQVFVVMGVAGLGVGCTFAALPGLILPAVPRVGDGQRHGLQPGAADGGLLGRQRAVGRGARAAHPRRLGAPDEDGYVAAALVGAVACLVAGVASAVLPGRRAALPA